jgi:hypothetical protein
VRARAFVLTDLEDRALAACDDSHLEVRVAQDILGSWFDRVVPMQEIRLIYRRLFDLGLLRFYVKRGRRMVPTGLEGRRTRSLRVRATAKGRNYLSLRRHVVR